MQAGRFAEARPLLAALGQAPGFALQVRFLTGFMAAQEGDHAGAARAYKAILADDPRRTRGCGWSWASAMIALGQGAAADRQLRLAQQSRELDPDLARLVRGAREVIRSRRAFRADVSLGLAPDSNINNATDARVVNVRLGDLELPLSLNDDARARSGTGVTAVGSAAAQLPVGADWFALGNVDASGTNYPGARFDDYLIQLAAGGEAQLSDAVSVSLQAIGAQALVRRHGREPPSRCARRGAAGARRRAPGRRAGGPRRRPGLRRRVRRMAGRALRLLRDAVRPHRDRQRAGLRAPRPAAQRAAVERRNRRERGGGGRAALGHRLFLRRIGQPGALRSLPMPRR
ncbi:hypothetical protein AB5I41_23425 [Sphingomonas sp. MMS24-JH45]